VDADEEDTEIRIVKRVEDYYPENKFTARYNNERVLVFI